MNQQDESENTTRYLAAFEEDNDPFPLTDAHGKTYKGFPGGLYPQGENEMPVGHAHQGLIRGARVRPLDSEGRPTPAGKYVLLSLGFSNTSQEFCSPDDQGLCHPWSFIGQAERDPGVNHTQLVIVNGAENRQEAKTWVNPRAMNYQRIFSRKLKPLGLSEKQVQIVWIKVTHANPGLSRPSLPAENADAYVLLGDLARIVRAVKVRYPNIQQVFVSSRSYAGYAKNTINPEPYAYESGFAVKWLIAAQIDQIQSGSVHYLTGDLAYDSVAPWLAWGPYLWANGIQPRSDGLTWQLQDFYVDGTHFSLNGVKKAGTLLLAFFKTSPFTRPWFLATDHQPEP
jgi:hypothetical protein